MNHHWAHFLVVFLIGNFIFIGIHVGKYLYQRYARKNYRKGN